MKRKHNVRISPALERKEHETMIEEYETMIVKHHIRIEEQAAQGWKWTRADEQAEEEWSENDTDMKRKVTVKINPALRRKALHHNYRIKN